MGKRIVFQRQDGGVSVVIPVASLDIHEIARQAVPPGTSYSVLEETEIPSDRYFRSAWTYNGESVVIDMAKAREVHKDRIRADRKPLLEALDIEFMRAVELGDAEKQAEISAKKQELRDATTHPGIAVASTPDELRAVIPSVLRGVE